MFSIKHWRGRNECAVKTPICTCGQQITSPHLTKHVESTVYQTPGHSDGNDDNASTCRPGAVVKMVVQNCANTFGWPLIYLSYSHSQYDHNNSMFNVSTFYAGGAESEGLYGLLQVTHNSNSKGVNAVFLKVQIRQNWGADIPQHFLCSRSH